jgi:hypothetical protein
MDRKHEKQHALRLNSVGRDFMPIENEEVAYVTMPIAKTNKHGDDGKPIYFTHV